MTKTKKARKQRVTKQQRATLAFLQRMEASGTPFTMQQFSDASGYGIENASLTAKLNRSEFAEFLLAEEDGKFKAQGTIGLMPEEYARRVSSKSRAGILDRPSEKLADKSIQAALSAIEIYNKPDFKYREESFSILMVNAWELLLKAKILLDNGEDERSIQQKGKDGKVISSRSGNPRTISIGESIKAINLEQVLMDHLFVLIEMRDNAVHLMNDSPMLKVKMQEVGTATLRNYLEMAKEWFKVDLSRYNFYLMPMSFFHPHELQSYSINSEPVQHQNMLRYIGTLEETHATVEDSRFSIGLVLETKFVKSTMRYAPDDPNAIPVKFESEEAFRRKYKWRYTEDLLPAMRKRYKDFAQGQKFNDLVKGLKGNPRFAAERHLDPDNPKGQKKWFYCSEILKEFDKHYTKK